MGLGDMVNKAKEMAESSGKADELIDKAAEAAKGAAPDSVDAHLDTAADKAKEALGGDAGAPEAVAPVEPAEAPVEVAPVEVEAPVAPVAEAPVDPAAADEAMRAAVAEKMRADAAAAPGEGA